MRGIPSIRKIAIATVKARPPLSSCLSSTGSRLRRHPFEKSWMSRCSRIDAPLSRLSFASARDFARTEKKKKRKKHAPRATDRRLTSFGRNLPRPLFGSSLPCDDVLYPGLDLAFVPLVNSFTLPTSRLDMASASTLFITATLAASCLASAIPTSRLTFKDRLETKLSVNSTAPRCVPSFGNETLYNIFARGNGTPLKGS